MRQDFENKMKLAQTTLSRRDSLKIARRFNAGNGSPCASSPAGTAENVRPFQPSLWDSIHFASPPGVETPGYCHPSLRDKPAANFSKLRRSDLFVENRSAQDSKLRRSGIFLRRKDVAPTELNNFLIALATKIPLLRSCGTTTAGARASARFNVHCGEAREISSPLPVRELKRRERRAPCDVAGAAGI